MAPAVIKNSCGILLPADSSAPAITLLAIMNSAFRMLLAAMMRARCVGGLRSCTSAYIGTL
ncbi:hypothetical protein D3C85_1690820 [compost metagenome]